jgi:hypothetical protein
VAQFDVITPRAVRPLVDELAGKGAGYRDVHAQLGRDPCAAHLGAYRLSGPLEPVVCGLHLRRDWRLAFTMQPPERAGEARRVIILFVGRREPRHLDSDAWSVLHDLFGVENPPSGHHQRPCCEAGQPEISDEELDAFLGEVQLMTRGRR